VRVIGPRPAWMKPAAHSSGRPTITGGRTRSHDRRTWRLRPTFRGVMRRRLKDTPDSPMSCRFARNDELSVLADGNGTNSGRFPSRVGGYRTVRTGPRPKRH
jgi:hypothetical protein